MLHIPLKPLFKAVHSSIIRPGCLAPLTGLILTRRPSAAERVCDPVIINLVLEPDRINGAIGPPLVQRHNFEDTRPAQSLEHLGVRVNFADLGDI